jgi:hypothetical protein
MKISLHTGSRQNGFVLLLVMILLAISLLILGADLLRTSTVANLNQRNNEYLVCSRAAEAAVEKAYASMAADFQSGAVSGVQGNLTNYASRVPSAAENPFWTNCVFMDPATGTTNQTYVQLLTNYGGALPSAYVGLVTSNAPVYRIISNVKLAHSSSGVVGTAQEDVLLALVPLSTWAIFYNGLLEFSTCATMTVNGRVHANGPIYAGSGSMLTFNSGVTTTSKVTYPANNGQGPWTASSVTYAVQPNTVPTVNCSLNMTNAHFQIDIPPSDELAMSVTGSQRLYNKANVILLVTNSSTVSTNVSVKIILQDYSNNGLTLPGADANKDTNTFVFTNITATALSNTLPFLNLTNSFYDDRENKTNIVTQINVGSYSNWISTNNTVLQKFQNNGKYPTVLYVADQRTNTSKNMAVVRLSNATQLPSNNGMGFTVATQNPLYTLGDYNITTSSGTSKGTNNLYEVPAALLSDALTVLSSQWSDSTSWNHNSAGNDNAVDTTINAAIVTGTTVSTDTTAAGFSGGVHNLPRLLENWTGDTLYLNTSILRLFDSKIAIGQFITPGSGSYYTPPTRKFYFDTHFLDPAKNPQGIPVAWVPIRFSWTEPPPGTVNTVVNDN